MMKREFDRGRVPMTEEAREKVTDYRILLHSEVAGMEDHWGIPSIIGRQSKPMATESAEGRGGICILIGARLGDSRILRWGHSTCS